MSNKQNDIWNEAVEETRSREIKFRAWDKNFKTMVQVNDAKFVDGLLIGAKGINWDSTVVVMQLTGLLLKNKEVYAGDIISFPDTESEYVDVGVGDMKVAETNVRGWGEVVFKNYSWGLEINMSCESVEKGFTSFAELVGIFEEQDL